MMMKLKGGTAGFQIEAERFGGGRGGDQTGESV